MSIPQPKPVAEPVQLIVFSDDWGRHPSSCQHLVRELAERHSAIWVNTIGTRQPTMSAEDVKKIAAKFKEWTASTIATTEQLPENLSVITPRMYPGFRTGWQRRINAGLISKAVNEALAKAAQGTRGRRVVITTLPITADLVELLDVDRWLYYCVDDLSQWPGLDGEVLAQMEMDLVGKVDAIVAVNMNLQKRMKALGRTSHLLTHGIDLDHWLAPAIEEDDGRTIEPAHPLTEKWSRLPRPICLFWGLVDMRLDAYWCRALVGATGGTLALVGPQQSPNAGLVEHPQIELPGPVAYHDLPAMAADADVLVMPYADLPVTRAMQPLKFKEYLATNKAVVARNLPALKSWQHAADLVDESDDFIDRVLERVETGPTAEQLDARRGLDRETWAVKASLFEQYVVETLDQPRHYERGGQVG